MIEGAWLPFFVDPCQMLTIGRIPQLQAVTIGMRRGFKFAWARLAYPCLGTVRMLFTYFLCQVPWAGLRRPW